MSTLKQVAVGLAVVAVMCAGMAWYTMAPEIKGAANRAAADRGRDVPFPSAQPEVFQDFGPIILEADVAKTAVPGSSLSSSCIFRHAIWPGMDGLDLYVLTSMSIGPTGLGVLLSGTTDDISHPGEYGFKVEWGGGGIGQEVERTYWYEVPEDGADLYFAEIDFEWWIDASAHKCTHGTNPIGDKGATHAKECTLTEEWEIPDGTDGHLTMMGETFTGTWAVDTPVPLDFALSITGIDADNDWFAYMQGAKYTLSIEDISFCGNPIDTSTFAATEWGDAGGHDGKLWVEGFGGSSIGFWVSENFIPPPFDYSDYPLSSITAPYSYDFSHLILKWMDGTDVDGACELYCTGLRTLNASGIDVGPWHGSIAALRALGRYTQQHGCYYWDTWDPDMQAEVQLYLDLTSAEALGIDVRGPRPAYKVEGAGFDEVPPDPSPVDGQYAPAGTYNGETMYTNGSFYLYCTDTAGPDWGIGPGPGSDPYYTQDGGGPAGAYVANTDSYGSGYLGDAPSVSANTTEAISLDSHLATPGFNHDGTFIFDCWPLSATNRTDAPYMTDVCTLAADATKDIYADAHTHEDWTGTNCGTPTAGGEFTVGAGGGSLALTLACNYPARQTSSGVGAIQVPTRYRVRRHDALLGTGNPEEEEEAVWDWRGRYLLQSFQDLSLPCDLTCRIVYYDDLLGCTDNHKTDSTRQTTYGYDPGPAYTLERTITVTYADVSGWSPVLIDLYDEQNGHPVARVESIEWEFPAAGTFTMTEPQLVLDPGDRQEVVSADPYYREAPASIGAVLKVDEHWQYAQGVVSAHVNGLCDRVLFMPDHAKPCTTEKCFDTLNVLIGAQTGLDLTTVYSLGAWPITNSGEAWTWTHSAANEAAHMKDSDDAVLKTLTVADIRPEWALAASGSTITPSVAVRCYSITCVRGLAYTFAGRKIVNGRGHGMVVRNGRQDYPRARGGKGGGLYRRHLGSSDPWQGVEAALTGDEHGHWSSEAHEISDTDAARTMWEYAAGGVLMGRWATREFALAQIFELLRKQPDLAEDKFGRPVVVYVHDGDVWCSRIETLAGVPEAPIMVVDADDAIHPAVELMDDGLLVVTWTDGGAAYMRHSTDGGQTWVDVV